jgi:hypothetical protein
LSGSATCAGNGYNGRALTGLPEAIEAVWPHTTVQTCVVHLIRAAMKFVSYKDRRAMVAALKDIYTAATVEAAETALLTFADSPLGKRYLDRPIHAPPHPIHLDVRFVDMLPVTRRVAAESGGPVTACAGVRRRMLVPSVGMVVRGGASNVASHRQRQAADRLVSTRRARLRR